MKSVNIHCKHDIFEIGLNCYNIRHPLCVFQVFWTLLHILWNTERIIHFYWSFVIIIYSTLHFCIRLCQKVHESFLFSLSLWVPLRLPSFSKTFALPSPHRQQLSATFPPALPPLICDIFFYISIGFYCFSIILLSIPEIWSANNNSIAAFHRSGLGAEIDKPLEQRKFNGNVGLLFRLDVKRLATRVGRASHLQSSDYFDIGHHPTMHNRLWLAPEAAATLQFARPAFWMRWSCWHTAPRLLPKTRSWLARGRLYLSARLRQTTIGLSARPGTDSQQTIGSRPSGNELFHRFVQWWCQGAGVVFCFLSQNLQNMNFELLVDQITGVSQLRGDVDPEHSSEPGASF